MYTPLSTLTLDELTEQVTTSENPSWAELELLNRVDQLRDEIEDLKNELAPQRVLVETLTGVDA